jgi:hypothetical protein
MSHFKYSRKSFSHNDQRNFKQIRAVLGAKSANGMSRGPQTTSSASMCRSRSACVPKLGRRRRTSCQTQPPRQHTPVCAGAKHRRDVGVKHYSSIMCFFWLRLRKPMSASCLLRPRLNSGPQRLRFGAAAGRSFALGTDVGLFSPCRKEGHPPAASFAITNRDPGNFY